MCSKRAKWLVYLATTYRASWQSFLKTWPKVENTSTEWYKEYLQNKARDTKNNKEAHRNIKEENKLA